MTGAQVAIVTIARRQDPSVISITPAATHVGLPRWPGPSVASRVQRAALSREEARPGSQRVWRTLRIRRPTTLSSRHRTDSPGILDAGERPVSFNEFTSRLGRDQNILAPNRIGPRAIRQTIARRSLHSGRPITRSSGDPRRRITKPLCQPLGCGVGVGAGGQALWRCRGRGRIVVVGSGSD